MNDIDLKTLPAGALDDLSIDVDALLSGVERRHRHRRARRRAGTGLAVLAVTGLVATAALRIGGDPAETTDRTDEVGPASQTGATDTTAAPTTTEPTTTTTAWDDPSGLGPYAMSTDPDAPALATVDGVEITYLPDGTPPEPEIGTGNETSPDIAYVSGRFDAPGSLDGLRVTVTRAPGLDFDSYQEGHWLGEIGTTTVDGRPAVIARIPDDNDSTGIYWSPEDGVVLDVHIDTELADELAPIIGGLRLP